MGVLRIIKKSIIGFIDHQIYLHAAALTFYSLLSLVPLLGIAFGIAQSLGLETTLQIYIMDQFAQYQDFTEKMIVFSKSYLDQAKGGWFAIVFALFYFWIVLTLFASLENAFNIIWDAPRGRPILRRLLHYFILVFICPLFAIASSVVSVIFTEEIISWSDKISTLSPLILSLWSIIPIIASWILFLLLYKYVPNVPVSWKEALIASFLAGTAYQISQWIFIHFQIGVAQYGAIFGSFAAFPLFMLWLQLSWIILLYGAEIAAKIK